MSSNLLLNASQMKTIGEIRRQRLLQLVRATGQSYADMNSRLGRNRRDATLTQVAKGAPSSGTGKPRQMGDAQARAIEEAYKLPTGWFDLDPAFGVDVEALNPDGTVKLGHGFTVPAEALAAQEPQGTYGAAWPFLNLKPADFQRLTSASLATLEQMIAAYLGSPSPPDWRATALRLAAKLDKQQEGETFTTFVRAVEFELSKPNASQAAASGIKS